MTYQIEMSHPQLVYTIEALYENILDRMIHSMSADVDGDNEWRRNVEFELHQGVMSELVQIYGKMFQTYYADEQAELTHKWETSVRFTGEQWDILNKILMVDSWDELKLLSEEELNAVV